MKLLDFVSNIDNSSDVKCRAGRAVEVAARVRNLGLLRRPQRWWVRQTIGERGRLWRKVKRAKVGEGRGTRRQSRVRHKAIGERKGYLKESGQELHE